jgi:F420-non-reducing hydrogenase iron-sulfur subunit
MSNFEPKILVFCCNWCSYAGADLAGTSRLKIKPNFRALGADGVLVAGCHPGDCHYSSGNYKARRRVSLLHNVLPQLGIEPERLRLEWISASEGTKFRNTVNEFIDQIAQLGPLHSNGKGEVKAGEVVKAKGS